MPNDDSYWRHVMDDNGANMPPNASDPHTPSAQVPFPEQAVPPAYTADVQVPAGSAQDTVPASTATDQTQPEPPAQVPPAASWQVPQASASQTQPEPPAQVPPAASWQVPPASAGQVPPAPTGRVAPAYSTVQPAYGTADTPAPKSHGWIVAIVIVVAVAIVIMQSVGSCTSMFGSLYSRSGADSLDTLTGDTVGIISISGTIQYDNSACSPEGLKELLDRAEENDHIKAVVLRVDSGGGTATAGEEMAEYVKRFSKPIVVSSASINASAAYEISSQADYIYVAKSTEIGAIGTAMQLTDLSGLLDKLGVNMETITSSDSKDSSYGYRELTDEERAYYQAMIDQINEVFIQNVAEGRGMDVKDVRALATGMPFTGLTSVENGLADEIGTREDALDKAAELAGLTGSYDTVYIDFDYYDLSSLYTLLGSSSNADDVLEALGLDETGAHIR